MKLRAMFQDTTIRGKLLAGFALIGIFVIVAGYVGISSTRRVGRLFDAIVSTDVPRIQALLEMKNAASEVAAQTINFRLIGQETAQAEGSVAADMKYRLLAAIERLQKWEHAYESQIQPGEEARSRFLRRVAVWRDLVVGSAIELINLKERGASGPIVKDKTQLMEAAQGSLQRIIGEALAVEAASLQSRADEVDQTADRATRTSVFISLAAMTLALLIGYVIARAVSEPVVELRNTAVEIAQGHLNKRVTVRSSGEIGQLARAFNEMADQNESLLGIVERSRAESERLRLQAEESNRMKDKFLASISHELRTPLNAIIGFSQLLHDEKMGGIAPEQKEFLGDILASSRHLLVLINDVLDLAKVASGKIEFRPERVDLTSLVTEVKDILLPLAMEKGIALHLEVDSELGDVVTDPSRLQQVLYNYLSNAIKFTPGKGRVTVRAGPDGADNFRLEVEDTGIGIRPEDIKRLFVEFQQLDGRAPGTGLGLALTRRLVEAQGGSVGVRSEPGKGSTFFAIMPRTAQRYPLSSVRRPEH